MLGNVVQRGFLPAHDPLAEFPARSELTALDQIGRDLPAWLDDPHFRSYARRLSIPPWPHSHVSDETIPLLRLYYVRIGFLASAYVNQVGRERATILPKNIAVPLCQACRLLGRPPILSYDGYALYNWQRLDPVGPIALGNIDTFQNFVQLYDEHWFILVHVEIEALAADILAAIAQIRTALEFRDEAHLNSALANIAATVWRQVEVLRRIPERMDPSLYYKTFRPYIRFFDNVVYEGVEERPLNFRGETGAQSSIMPTLVALMKIQHQQSVLTDHLADMRRFMPREHRAVIEEVERMPSVRPLADKAVFNDVLEAMATFREVHFGWAQEYIQRHVADPRGETGAQSSIMPTLVALMRIQHQQSVLTDHLADMRRFMPREHRAVIEEVERMPSVRPLADKAVFNDVLEAMATFREVHFGWAQEYIQRHVSDPRGTGGTPYMQWLGQLIEETRAAKM